MAWVIDQKHSYVGFSIKHMMFTTVRGQFHRYGGTIDIDMSNLTASKFRGEIDVASIDTHEPKRDEHLRSAEFFDVARFPTMAYESTQIEALGGSHFRVQGKLTLHGVTRDITMEGDFAGGPYKDPNGIMRSGFSATGNVNRKDFGLTWNLGLEAGGVLVGETVTIQLDIELMYQVDQAAA